MTDSDICEFDPEQNRAAYILEGCRNRSSVIVGAKGQWRLCEPCSRLPYFARFRKRTPIKHKAEGVA